MIIDASIPLLAMLAPYANALPTYEADSFALAKREDGQYNSGDGTYTDGQGTYVGTDDEHRYASGIKCWTDHFVVSQEVGYEEWKPASDKVYCTGTSQCQVSKMTGSQKCESWSISMSAGMQSEIFNFGIEAGYDLQECNMAQDTSSCVWDDGQCHVIWSQQQLLSQKGYQRRRCDDGSDYTAWMKDFEHIAPTDLINYGCGSSCSDSE